MSNMKKTYSIDRVNRPKDIIDRNTLREISKGAYKIITLLNNIISEDVALDCFVYTGSL